MATSTTNDLLAHADIHMGFWINWSKGSVRGATLTLNPGTGAFLIAFTAIFVQYTGGQFWGILRFILHLARVSQRPQDGLYHQQQAILRNQSSGAAAVDFLRGTLIWRTRAINPIRRSGLLGIIALVHLLGFLVAALFSTKVSSASGDQVLVESFACGSLDFGIQDVRVLWDLLLPYNQKANLDSASYARSCYSEFGNSGSWQDCRTFPTPNINLRRENTTCPFSGMCTAPAVSFDTGLMDSDFVFGVNAPQEDKLAYRKVISCAPIKVDQYTQTKLGTSARTNYTEPEQAPELQYVELYYGKAFYNSPEGTETSNYTYRYRDFVDYQNISAGAFPDIFDYVVQ